MFVFEGAVKRTDVLDIHFLQARVSKVHEDEEVKSESSYLLLGIQLQVCMITRHDWRVKPSIILSCFEGGVPFARASDIHDRFLSGEKESAIGECKRGGSIEAGQGDDNWSSISVRR